MKKDSSVEKLTENKNNPKVTGKIWLLLVIVALITIGVISFISNNESKNLKSAQPESSKKYEKLTLNAQKEGENIAVKGETDLPDDSKLTIEITRPVTWKGETEQRHPTVGWSNPVVKGGKYSAIVKIDDSKAESEDNSSVDSKCEVAVSFHPNWYGEKNQNDTVLNLVGRQGENLSGQFVKTIGELTDKPYKILKNSAPVEFPYSKATPKSQSKYESGSIHKLKNTGSVLFLGTTKENWDRLSKYIMANDSIGVNQMIYSGEAFSADGGAAVKTIDFDWGKIDIRILEGTNTNMEGWISEIFIE